ncbi:MAG: hypothetical protein ACO1RX_23600 [Candidatus Sericytochromatia bacterium]
MTSLPISQTPASPLSVSQTRALPAGAAQPPATATQAADAPPAQTPALTNATQLHLSADVPAQSLTFPTPTGTPAAVAPPVETPPELVAAQAHLQQRFQTLARDNPDGLKALLGQVYGDKATPEQLDTLMQQAREGTLPMPEMRFRPAAELEGHHGAYAASEGVIYLSEDLRHAPGLLNLVVEAEIGHHFDQVLGGSDRPGDEGQMLALGLAQGGGPLSPEDLEAARALSDSKILQIDGRSVEVETIAPAVAAGLWWAGQVTAKTGVDAAIDYSIAAILGVPPPGTAAHIGNALANAVPGLGYWRTSRKLQRLGRAINEVRQSFAAIGRMPGGQQVQAAFNAAARDLQSALRSGNVVAAQRKMTELLDAIQNAHLIRAGKGALSTFNRGPFYQRIANLNPGERVALINPRAREYARAMEWEPMSRLSARNNDRLIFYDRRNDRYLSVDTQHGDFEILDRRGRHQGSMDLWGEQTQSRHSVVDRSGRHDIRVD